MEEQGVESDLSSHDLYVLIESLKKGGKCLAPLDANGKPLWPSIFSRLSIHLSLGKDNKYYLQFATPELLKEEETWSAG